jgi:hypothetical protein
MNELQRLTELEKIIEGGLQTFYEVGKALNEIRESKLYKENYKTFDDYCRERWGMSKTHANRYIIASDVADNLTPIGAKIETESQARELSKADPEQQAEIYRSVIEKTNGRPTAKAIKEEIAEAEIVELPPITYNIEYNIKCTGITILVHKIWKQSKDNIGVINEIIKEFNRLKRR